MVAFRVEFYAKSDPESQQQLEQFLSRYSGEIGTNKNHDVRNLGTFYYLDIDMPAGELLIRPQLKMYYPNLHFESIKPLPEHDKDTASMATETNIEIIRRRLGLQSKLG